MYIYFVGEEENKILGEFDLSALKEKGLSEERICAITMLSKEFICKYFQEMDRLRQHSGIF
jgi:hypothetical protein